VPKDKLSTEQFDDQGSWDQWLALHGAASPGVWLKIAKAETAERLIERNRVTPAGLREIEAAKSDGRWASAYVGQRLAEPPADLLEALLVSPKARREFDVLDRANRYAIIYRVQDAKKAETRAKRIATYVAMLESGKTLHPKRARRR
jgi:uncharacterized protein YdeI (YjbR/CyaY-like superfamily)